MIATVGCSQKITAVDLESDVRTFGATAANEAGGPPVPGGRVGVRPVPGAENEAVSRTPPHVDLAGEKKSSLTRLEHPSGG
ncbi:hypothetical protein B296_00019088 [Ensete ventricosum]|uniref:Uncharacterized protein n=1 Tax=Ensete ventricosum TaxID=4639 RepID=A0A426Z7E1_ENSVE|nr:hypothetical protein B296_00019088 [Ensete ventricosum]